MKPTMCATTSWIARPWSKLRNDLTKEEIGLVYLKIPLVLLLNLHMPSSKHTPDRKSREASGRHLQSPTRKNGVTQRLYRSISKGEYATSWGSDNWIVVAFTRNLKPISKNLKESLREFLTKIWNDVYHRYNTKLQIEDDISILLKERRWPNTIVRPK